LVTMTDLADRAEAFRQAHLPTGDAGAAAVRLAVADYLQTARALQRADLIRSLALPVFAPPFLSAPCRVDRHDHDRDLLGLGLGIARGGDGGSVGTRRCARVSATPGGDAP
jgi:hypothetical protein